MEPGGQEEKAADSEPLVKPSQNPGEAASQAGHEKKQSQPGISPWKVTVVILCCVLIVSAVVYLGLKLMRKEADVPRDQK